MDTSYYQQQIDWLFQQFPAYQQIGTEAYKPGLENTFKLLEAFGNPHSDLKFIHVAGTNGKGSTCAILASILSESGEKVGLFSSPHIIDFCERIRVQGIMIEKQFVLNFIKQIQQLKLAFKPSFFEISWVMALVYFNQQKCTICVIETGLGGRLDATNCVHPEISVITNISLEHTQLLGDTVEQIAREKGGIIKKNIPVVIGDCQVSVCSIFQQLANDKNAKLYLLDPKDNYQSENFPLLGQYQQKNLNLAIKTLRILDEKFKITTNHIEQGLKHITQNTGFFGRMQQMQTKPRVIFDVSHNLAGIQETLNYFNSQQLIIVFGSSSDKNLNEIFREFPKKNRYFLTQFTNKRSANIEQLKQLALEQNLNANFFKDATIALKTAINEAKESETVLVFGSFFLLSDIYSDFKAK